MVERIKDFSVLNVDGDFTIFQELRMENDVNGNPVYIGYSNTPNAATSASVWYIVKITYDASQSPTRQQLPNAGPKFTYVWDSRSTYF